jgi:hypothetical protein
LVAIVEERGIGVVDDGLPEEGGDGPEGLVEGMRRSGG